MNIKTFDELLAAAEAANLEIFAFVQKMEAEFLEISEKDFRARVLNIFKTMEESVKNGLNSKELSKSGLCGENTGILKSVFGLPAALSCDDASRDSIVECKGSSDGNILECTGANCGGTRQAGGAHTGQGLSLFSAFQRKVMLYSLAVIEENARMGKIAACPTAGSSGIVPGVLIALRDEFNLDYEIMTDALITAGIVGEIISAKMALAGAVAGCQAECGVASAMAAAACTFIILHQNTCKEAAPGDFTPDFADINSKILNVVSLALKNILGLTCDPVAGLVEVPCVKRNVFMAMHALVASELAISGIKSKIPLDEIIDAMKETGDLMATSLKESSEAGLAKTNTGISIENLLKEKLA